MKSFLFQGRASCLYLFLCSIFLIPFSGLSQTTGDSQLFGVSPPALVPNSPEASSLGRYGSLPINTSTGKMEFSVPLCNISVDGKSMPVSFSYTYNGLLLEGKPSIAGLGWSLSAGGAVTREIRGLPDENEFGYYSNVNDIKGKVYDYINGGIDAWSLNLLRDQFFAGNYDSEVDKYTVSAGGLYFSFKIGLDNQIVKLSKHANKVDIIWNTTHSNRIDSFIVTDLNGTKYTFSEIEFTRPRDNEENVYIYGPTITSWNLSKVTYVNGQEVSYNYVTNVYNDYNFTAAGAVTYANVAEVPGNSPFYISPTYNDYTTEAEIERKLLKQISFPKGNLTFTIADSGTKKIYSECILRNKQNKIINHYVFTHQGTRDLLTKVTKNSLPYFDFDYYDEFPIPGFLTSVFDKALAQDPWKYYNGQTNNAYALNIPNSQYISNQDVSFQHTRLGAMKSVTYATGGTTEISYEQNQIKTDNVIDGEYYDNLQATKLIRLDYEYDDQDPSNPQNSTVVEATQMFEYPTVANISHFISGQQVGSHITLRIERTDGQACENGYPEPELTTPSFQQEYYQEAPWLRQAIIQSGLPYDAEIPIFCPKLVEEFGPDSSGQQFVTVMENSGGKILIMPGTYKFSIIPDPNLLPQVTAYINVQLYGPLNQAPPEFTNQDVGGLRVSQLVDCPKNGSSQCVTRSFDYNRNDGFSSGMLYTVPQTKQEHSYNITTASGSYYYETHTFLSNPFTVANPSQGTPIFYCEVAERNGTGQGYTTATYSFPRENIQGAYPRMPRGTDLDKSLPQESKVFLEGAATSLRKNSTNYQMVRALLDPVSLQDSNANHPWSLKVVKKQDLNLNFNLYSYSQNPAPGAQENAVKNLYLVVPYKEVDNWDRKISDFSEATENSVQITNTSTYEYDFNDTQLLTKQTTTDSEGDVLEQEFFYPGDIADPIYDAMKANNQVAEAIQTKSYRNGTLLVTKETQFVANADGHKPYQVNAAKADHILESKLRFSYDNKGMPREVMQLTGDVNQATPNADYFTAYLWGYNEEFPVIKADNTTFATLETTVNAALQQANLSSNFSSLETFLVSLNAIQSNSNQQEDWAKFNIKLRELIPPESRPMLTTYTYDPLVGVTSVTDPRGYTMYYEYDEFNRLQYVRDADNNLISENQYNYKNQN